MARALSFMTHPGTPAPDLVTRTRAGDSQALGELYSQHARALMALAFRLLGSRQDAEDVLHDVFLGLPEAFRSYEEQGRLESWLKRLTVRTCLTLLRTHARRRELDLDAVSHPTLESSIDPSVDDRIARAIASLSPALRAVFVLREIEGYGHVEIATFLGISTNTSEVRLHRAMRQLRRHLGSIL